MKKAAFGGAALTRYEFWCGLVGQARFNIAPINNFYILLFPAFGDGCPEFLDFKAKTSNFGQNFREG